MAIFKEKAFGVKCDRCEKEFENPYTGKRVWENEEEALQAAKNYAWIEHENDCYCPMCYDDIDEDIVIKPKI